MCNTANVTTSTLLTLSYSPHAAPLPSSRGHNQTLGSTVLCLCNDSVFTRVQTEFPLCALVSSSRRPQSKSASSTDSQPAEERQGPSGGYSSSQGGAEAKRRRCEDKEPLAPHSYVRAAAQSPHSETRRRRCLSPTGDAVEACDR